MSILEAAHALFAADGYHGVGLEKVAEAAGVSRQTIYLHFGTKAKLLVALGQYQHERAGIAELFDRTVWSADNAAAALDAWVEGLVVFAPHVLSFAATVEAARRSDPDVAVLYDSESESRHDGCRRLASWLKRDRLLAPPWTERTAADLLWTVCSLQTYEHLVTERRWTRKAFIIQMQAMLRRTLLHQDVLFAPEGSDPNGAPE